MKISRLTGCSRVAAATLAVLFLPGVTRADVRTVHQHAVLGFAVSGAMPGNVDPSDGLGCIPLTGICDAFYQAHLHDIVLSVSTAFGGDYDLSWDRADIRSGMSAPIDIAYTPTNDPGSEFSLTLDGTVSAQLEVFVPPQFCDVPDQSIHITATADDLHAPLSNDGAMTIPVESDSFLAACVGAIPGVFELKVVGTLTLTPVASFDSTTLTPPINPLPLLGGTTLPGVGGGTGTFSVDSASGSLLTGASIAEIAANQFPMEWQTSGEAKTRNVLLKNPLPSTPMHTELGSVLHWVEVGGSLDLSISVPIFGHVANVGIVSASDIESAINDRKCQGGPNDGNSCTSDSDCTPNTCGGDLGESVGDKVKTLVETTLNDPSIPPIPDVVAARMVLPQAYSDAFRSRVDALQVPIPLFDPAGATVTDPANLPPFGVIPFDIITDSDGDGIPDGDEIAMGLDPDNPDTDGDGLTDGEEIHGCTDPKNPDTDGDGYGDGVEVLTAHCNACDGSEIPLQPTIFQGSRGGGAIPPKELMTYAAPAKHTVRTSVDLTCAPDGLCAAGFCIVGKIADACSNDGDCDQPPTTCRVVINFRPDATNLTLLKSEYNKATLTNVLSPPGCSRKLDLPIDPGVNRNKLRLLATGTVAGRTRRDNDTFGFHH